MELQLPVENNDPKSMPGNNYFLSMLPYFCFQECFFKNVTCYKGNYSFYM